MLCGFDLNIYLGWHFIKIYQKYCKYKIQFYNSLFY